MKVLKLNTPFEISAIVRIAPTQSDNLIFTAINEVSQANASYTIVWTLQNGRLNLILDDNNPEFKAGNKYEISIKNMAINQIIYRGKMIVVNQDTDIQNYTPSKQTTQRFK